MNTSDAFDIAHQFLGRGTQLEDFLGELKNVTAFDMYHFMSPSFVSYEGQVTNDILNISLLIF